MNLNATSIHLFLPDAKEASIMLISDVKNLSKKHHLRAYVDRQTYYQLEID